MRPVDMMAVAISLVIVALVFWSVHRHGRTNPESTGKLSREIKKQAAAITALETKVGACATRGALDLLAEQVRNLEAHAASSGEVIHLSAQLAGLRELMEAKLNALEDAKNETREGVRRIEAILMKGALDR